MLVPVSRITDVQRVYDQDTYAGSTLHTHIVHVIAERNAKGSRVSGTATNTNNRRSRAHTLHPEGSRKVRGPKRITRRAACETLDVTANRRTGHRAVGRMCSGAESRRRKGLDIRYHRLCLIAAAPGAPPETRVLGLAAAAFRVVRIVGHSRFGGTARI